MHRGELGLDPDEVFFRVGKCLGVPEERGERFSTRWIRPTPPSRNACLVMMNPLRGAPSSRRCTTGSAALNAGLVDTAMSKLLIWPMTP